MKSKGYNAILDANDQFFSGFNAKKPIIVFNPDSTLAKAGKTITVEQVGSPIRREAAQRQTLIGLKLNKLHRTSTLEDTPAVRGMIEKVKHLVRVVDGQ